MSSRFEISYNEAITAETLWIKMSSFLYTSVISETEPDLVTILAMEAQPALEIDEIQLSGLHLLGMSQKSRFLKLKQIVDGQNKLKNTAIEKFINILINLDAFKSISEEIRLHITKKYSLEIIEKDIHGHILHSTPPAETSKKNIGVVTPTVRDLQEDVVDATEEAPPTSAASTSYTPSYIS